MVGIHKNYIPTYLPPDIHLNFTKLKLTFNSDHFESPNNSSKWTFNEKIILIIKEKIIYYTHLQNDRQTTLDQFEISFVKLKSNFDHKTNFEMLKLNFNV